MPNSGWSGDAQRRLNALLHLPARGDEQDWDLELADAARCGEFLAAYEHLQGDDDRRALMALILASYDDRLPGGDVDDALWQSIAAKLRAEYALHEPLVRYWSLVDHPETVDGFHLTQLIKAVLQRGDA